MTSLEARGRLAILLCVAVVALVAAPNFFAPFRPYDAGIASSVATFTIHGLLPYRDYWFLYGPLSPVLVAIPTAIVGPSVELIRLLGFLIVCAQAGLAFHLARRWVSVGPAIAIGVASVVMYPSLLGLEPSSWMVAVTLGLAAMAAAVSTGRGGLVIGVLAGLTLLARLDVGAYALLSVLILDRRRATILGFAVVAVPFAVLVLVTTDLASLFEQLIWYPIVGPRQFRGLPGPEAVIGQPAAWMMSVPLLLVPRIAIGLALLRIGVARARRTLVPDAQSILVIVVFALLCQLQTLGRADIEHYAQAATPAILLLAVVYRDIRAQLPRFTVLAAIEAMCLVVGLLSVKYIGSGRLSREDRAVLVASSWIRQATGNDEPIFVGLTSHRYTVNNPLLVYYLSSRRSGVHDAMFNPGVTNTEWGQTRMVEDLDRTATTFLVLDRTLADLHEEFNDSRIPGSTRLDAYISARYHVVCDLQDLVILGRDGAADRTTPSCPDLAD